jgi:hypothetical protein
MAKVIHDSSSLSSYIQEVYFRSTSFGSVAGHGVRYPSSMSNEFYSLHQGGRS